MKKILVGIFILISLLFPIKVYAEGCGARGINIIEFPPREIIFGERDSLTVRLSGLAPNTSYIFLLYSSRDGDNSSYRIKSDSNGYITLQIDNGRTLNTGTLDKTEKTWTVKLRRAGINLNWCDLGSYTVKPKREGVDSCNISISSTCDDKGVASSTLTVSNLTLNGQPYNGSNVRVNINFIYERRPEVNNGGFILNLGKMQPGTTGNVVVTSYALNDFWTAGQVLCKTQIIVPESCKNKEPYLTTDGTTYGEDGITVKPDIDSCPGSTEEAPIIKTSLGCIPTQPEALIGWVLKYAVSIGGGVAFLLMVFAGFLLSTSAGNPERVKQGQEMLTSAVVGLLFIIFSVFLLQFIGMDILKIPGFGG